MLLTPPPSSLGHGTSQNRGEGWNTRPPHLSSCVSSPCWTAQAQPDESLTFSWLAWLQELQMASLAIRITSCKSNDLHQALLRAEDTTCHPLLLQRQDHWTFPGMRRSTDVPAPKSGDTPRSSLPESREHEEEPNGSEPRFPTC